MLAALLMAGCAGSVHASLPGEIITGGGPMNSTKQQQVVNALITNGNASADEAHTAVIGASKGTLLPVVADVIGTGTKTGQNIQNALNSGGTSVLGSIRIFSGATATAGVNAAGNTVAAIGAPGGTLSNRMGAVRNQYRASAEKFGANSAMASAYMNNDLANRVWVSPFYVYQDMEKKDGYAAYSYKAYGGSLGYDRVFGPVTVGAAFTYSRGDYDEKGITDDTTIDNYGGSGYATYYSVCSGFWAGIAGGYNYGKNDLKSFDAIANDWQVGKNHTNTYWAGGNLGYDFNLGPNWILTPSAGLFWSDSKSSSYNSTGPYDMIVGKIKNKSLLMPLDLSATYTAHIDECSSVSVKVSGGYNYNIKNDGAEGSMRYNYAGSGSVFIQGVKPGRHGWNAGAGVKYTRNNIDVGVDYRYDGKKKYQGHRVSATIGVSF